ncbi:hypothetical protein HDU97_002160 [Phlyctochytrium planicorne]|nr:hypothetical protein HDU97_002160 [Phlyctochytrium planicorne]
MPSLNDEERAQLITVLSSVLKFLDEDPNYYPIFNPFFPNVNLGETSQTQRLPEAARKGYVKTFTTRLIKTWLRRYKAVFVFDDIQWMDSASQDILSQMMTFIKEENNAGHVYLMLCSRPSSELQPEQLEAIMSVPNLIHLSLSGFQQEDVDDFLIHSFENWDLKFVDSTVLKENGTLRFHPEKTHFVSDFLETSLSQAMMMQFDRLNPDFQILLRYASTCGQYFNLDDVTELLPNSDKNDWKTSIITQDIFQFLQEDRSGGYFFRHISIQTAIYESLSFAEQISLHRAFGQRLEDKLGSENAVIKASILPSLHYHWWRTNDVKRKISYAEELGLLYYQKGYHEESLSLFLALSDFVDGPSADTTIPLEYRSKSRLALWYSSLSNSASITNQTDISLEAALKTLAFHGHLALNTVIVLALLSSGNSFPPFFPIAALYEMMNRSIKIKDENPLMWTTSAGNMAFAFACVLPKSSRMYLDSAFSLAQQKNINYSSMFVYTSMYTSCTIDDGGQRTIDLVQHLVEFANSRNYEHSLHQGFKLFQSRFTYPNSVEEIESILLENFEAILIEHPLIALSTLVIVLQYTVLSLRIEKTQFYMDKISQM